MILLIYQKIEKNKEATNKTLRDLKARNKVEINNFKLKMSGV